MNIGEIFRDAFIYPIKSWKIFIALGLLIFVSDFSGVLNPILSGFETITIDGLFLGLISIIILVIIKGYHLSIIRSTFDHSNYMPSFDFFKNFVDGVKVFFVTFVYFLPLIIIWNISTYFLGFLKSINILSLYLNFHDLNYLNYFSQEILFDSGDVFLFILILEITLFFTTFAFFVIAKSRLAIYGNLRSAFQIREILNDISKIKWENYISWFIVFMVILGILHLFNGIIYFLGSISVVISLFVIYNYTQIFTSRNIGLIYKMIEKSEEYDVESVYY